MSIAQSTISNRIGVYPLFDLKMKEDPSFETVIFKVLTFLRPLKNYG
jgi:hypothetical protein